MAESVDHKQSAAQRRRQRVRTRVRGTADRPRLTVFRSGKYTYLQVVDDTAGNTLVASSEHDIKAGGTKTERAVKVAQALVEKMKRKGIVQLVFDRGSYRYHGRVKAVAEEVRKAGIQV